MALALFLSGCMSAGIDSLKPNEKSDSHVNDKSKFSVAKYGVAASPRVSRSKSIRKGGGRRQIGKPYKIRGKWYRPREQPGYKRTGYASWYGPNFHGRLTANGEIYDQYALSGAHPTFPLPSYARVTNTKNGHSVVVRVNDRGPYHGGRIIDLSSKAADLLNYKKEGVARVKVEYVGQAPLHGRDARYLAASYSKNGRPASPSILAANAQAQQRPQNVPNVDRLDPIETGAVTIPTNTPRPEDPFLKELAAIKQKKDTGTTLSVRLNPSYINAER